MTTVPVRVMLIALLWDLVTLFATTGCPGSSLAAIRESACYGSATSVMRSTFTTTSGPGNVNSGPGCSETSGSTCNSTSTPTGIPGCRSSATSGPGSSI